MCLLVVQWLEEFRIVTDQNEDGVLTLAEVTDMFHGARARAVERELQLRPELAELSVAKLRERAERKGANSNAVVRAVDSDDPKHRLIELICAVEDVEPPQRPPSAGAWPWSQTARSSVMVTRLTPCPCIVLMYRMLQGARRRRAKSWRRRSGTIFLTSTRSMCGYA